MKYLITVIAVLLVFLTGCKEADPVSTQRKEQAEKSEKILASIPVGDDEKLEMDAEPPPEGEKRTGGYITKDAEGYIKRCVKSEKVSECYENMEGALIDEAKALIDVLTNNIRLLPNDFQRGVVRKKLSEILLGADDCGNNAQCRAEVAARAYSFAVWIDEQAKAHRRNMEHNFINVSSWPSANSYCAASTVPVKIYDGNGDHVFDLKPPSGGSVFFMVYVFSEGQSIAVEARERFDPFQFNGRVIGYVDSRMRSEFTKSAQIFACERLNYIYIGK